MADRGSFNVLFSFDSSTSNFLLFYRAALVFGSLMLLFPTSDGLTNTFNVYAANNCDATSTCNNMELLSPNNQTIVEIDSDADSVVVTWWETNDTSDVPVMRLSNDNGETFGPLLKLASNGTIGGE